MIHRSQISMMTLTVQKNLTVSPIRLAKQQACSGTMILIFIWITSLPLTLFFVSHSASFFSFAFSSQAVYKCLLLLTLVDQVVEEE